MSKRRRGPAGEDCVRVFGCTAPRRASQENRFHKKASHEHKPQIMTYSRDGDQLCSNAAIAFAFIGAIISIVPQSTCSFMSINPVEVISFPTRWENISLLDNITGLNQSTIDKIAEAINDGVGMEQQEKQDGVSGRRHRQRRRRRRILRRDDALLERLILMHHQHQSDNVHRFVGDRVLTNLDLESFEQDFDPLNPGSWLPKRNITHTNLTANIGLWKMGTAQIDGKCRPITQVSPAYDDPIVEAARAMAIIASVAGFLGLVAACFTCHVDDKSRRRRNKYIGTLYILACLSAWFTFLMFNANVCQGKERVWKSGLLEGLVVLYGRCECRASCFLQIVVGCCFMISSITIFQYSG